MLRPMIRIVILLSVTLAILATGSFVHLTVYTNQDAVFEAVLIIGATMAIIAMLFTREDK